jgi:hypothetical protein
MEGMEFYDKGEDIGQFLQLKDLLLSYAEKLEVH